MRKSDSFRTRPELMTPIDFVIIPCGSVVLIYFSENQFILVTVKLYIRTVLLSFTDRKIVIF